MFSVYYMPTFGSQMREHLNKVWNNARIKYGLIIGKMLPDTAILVQCCSSQFKKEITFEDQLTTCIEDSSYFGDHVTEVLQSLPLGLEIVGMYIVAPINVWFKNDDKLYQVLRYVFSSFCSSSILTCRERVILTVCPVSNSIGARSFDVTLENAQPKSVANFADIQLKLEDEILEFPSLSIDEELSSLSIDEELDEDQKVYRDDFRRLREAYHQCIHCLKAFLDKES